MDTAWFGPRPWSLRHGSRLGKHKKSRRNPAPRPCAAPRPFSNGLLPLFFGIALLLSPGPGGATEQRPSVGVFLAGRAGARLNVDRPFTPASTIKILTALIAFDALGPEYRFATEFYLCKNTLWIKGSGDPLLVSEEIARIAAHLTRLGLPKISAIGIDETAFALEEPWPSPSANPYDAAPAALLVNFNTAFVTRHGKQIRSAERQTPTLPLMRQLAEALDKKDEARRLNVNRFGIPAHRYAGELFRALLGPQATGAAILTGVVPAEAQPLYRHRSSSTVRQAVAAMLRYSTNVIANQLFLASGGTKYGHPATWSKARRLARAYLDRIGVPAAACSVVEGSGLSRNNQMTPRAMIRLLTAFAPYRDLLPGRGDLRLKSGTLDGVANYAGYLACGNDWLPFAVFSRGQPRQERDIWLNRLRRQCQKGAEEKRSP